MSEEPTPTVWASIGTTIKTREYENIKLDFGVSGIPAGASKEFIDTKMKEATLTLQEIMEHLAAELSRNLQENFGR